jgi:hypothetical protein
MPIMFNTILTEAGLSLADVCLLRHQDNRADRGRTPYELWRDTRPEFDRYQSRQNVKRRQELNRGHWASFVGTPNNETLFVGVYEVKYRGLLEHDERMAHKKDGTDKAGSCDVYDLTLEKALSDLIGKALVDWGPGARAWVQHADLRNKPIVELRKEFKEPGFPGFLNFMEPLSRLDKLPKDWVSVFRSSRGVYLLACPKTKEQYIGSASGEDGFWGRWQDYVQTGHGGNVALMSREPSDYQVSVLEVAGTASTVDDIGRMEDLWKRKLKTREMGLNGN